MMKHFFLFMLLGSLFIVGCNLEQEIEIDLPEYDNQYVVECYLQPNTRYRLLLSRSFPYFAPFSGQDQFLDDLLINGAKVTIYQGDKRIRLSSGITFDFNNQKIFNYTSNILIPEDYESTFRLEIVTPLGDSIFGQTRILPPIPIDSIVTELNEDAAARVLTYFTDIPDQPNYYRRTLHQNSLDSLPLQDFTVDDRFVEDVFVFGSGYEFAVGDTVINTIHHIDQDYFLFLETYLRAVSSNGNPFGQPSPIVSNLVGTSEVIGIFTGLSFDRKQVIIKP